jgi:hypothetical protein
VSLADLERLMASVGALVLVLERLAMTAKGYGLRLTRQPLPPHVTVVADRPPDPPQPA